MNKFTNSSTLSNNLGNLENIRLASQAIKVNT